MTTTPDDSLFHEPPTQPGQTDSHPGGPGSTAAGSPGGPASQPGAGRAAFFDGIRRLGVVRPDSGRVAAGVAAGLARRWGVDPIVVRIGFAVLTIAGGLGVALYGLGWLLLPHADGRIHAEQALAGTVTPGFAGALLVTLAGAHHVAPLAVAVLIVFLIIRLIRGNRPRAV